MAGLKGGKMDSLIQVIEVLLINLVNDNKLLAWRLHVDIVSLL